MKATGPIEPGISSSAARELADLDDVVQQTYGPSTPIHFDPIGSAIHTSGRNAPVLPPSDERNPPFPYHASNPIPGLASAVYRDQLGQGSPSRDYSMAALSPRFDDGQGPLYPAEAGSISSVSNRRSALTTLPAQDAGSPVVHSNRSETRQTYPGRATRVAMLSDVVESAVPRPAPGGSSPQNTSYSRRTFESVGQRPAQPGLAILPYADIMPQEEGQQQGGKQAQQADVRRTLDMLSERLNRARQRALSPRV